MKLPVLPTNGIALIEKLAQCIAGKTRVAVVTGAAGTGKTFAAEQAAGAIAAKTRSKVLHLDFPFGTDKYSLARQLAKRLGVRPLHHMSPIAAMEELKSAFSYRHVSLIIADNVHRLDIECQQCLLGLIDPAVTCHRVGLLVLERSTNDSFAVMASEGYSPIIDTMPDLTANEIISFLVGSFPQVADEVEGMLGKPASELSKVATVLKKKSAGAIQKLLDVLDDLHAELDGANGLKFADIAAALGIARGSGKKAQESQSSRPLAAA